MKNIVWTYDTSENEFAIDHELTNYLKEVVDCALIKKFPPNIFSLVFLAERYHQNSRAFLAATRLNWLPNTFQICILIIGIDFIIVSIDALLK